MKKTTAPNLPHIQAHLLTAIAEKFNCSTIYVYHIVHGIRNAKSTKARQVLKAAKTLNKAIETSTQKINKEIILIGEND